MRKKTYYVHDYTAVSQVDAFLTQLTAEMRQGKHDMESVRVLIEVAEAKLREYLAKDNLVESEEGSLMTRAEGEVTLTEMAEEMKDMARRSESKVSFRMKTHDGFIIEVSAREMTEEEKQEEREEDVE
ncbi:MAG: hypothetical protein ACI36Z_01370 [Alloprevotella sp.]